MRILILHERFSPDSGGGGEYVALERARGLVRAGHTVRVLCAGDPAIVEFEGVATRRLRLPRRLAPLLAASAVAEAAKADLIHAFTYAAAPAAWLAGRLAGKPVVCEQLGLFGPVWRQIRPGVAGRVMEAMERRQVRLRYAAHVFLSSHSLALARSLGAESPAHVVPPGIDLDVVSDAPKADPPIVLFAGKFDRRKGFDRFCALAASLPEARFEAVGWEGDARLFGPPANVRVVDGRGAAYRDALARASILVAPSRAETFGLVLYEGMLAGCSIVSSIGASFAGALLDPYDDSDARAAVAMRLADRDLLRREGLTNRAVAATFNWERSTARIEDIYAKVAPAAAGPG